MHRSVSILDRLPRTMALVIPVCCGMLTGCGQTGPLLLPQDVPADQQANYLLYRNAPAAATTPASAPVAASAAR